MMAKLTKEQYELLQPYEKNIKNAYRNSFVHMTSSDFEKVAVIYAEVFGTPLRKGQMGCNTCRLNALKKLGELYMNYTKEDTEKKEKKTRQKKLANENLINENEE